MQQPRAHDVALLAGTIAACVVAVLAAASVQHLLVLDVPLSPTRYVVPTGVGATAGTLLGLLLIQRRRLRAAQAALVARDEAIGALNRELESRVEARTRELEEKTRALLVAQRLETVGRVAGGIAHDTNNLVTVLVGCAGQIRDLALPRPGAPAVAADLQATLADLDEAIEGIAGLTAQLLALNRAEPVERGPIDLRDVVTRAEPMMRRIAPAPVRLALQLCDSPCLVVGNRVQLGQVLLNLVVNARDAMPTGGELRVGVSNAAGRVHLEVRDTGQGMDEAVRARALEPLFSTKAPGKGTGLGLAVVHEVVSRAGGTIDLVSAPGQGTTVGISLPQAPA